MVFVGFAVFGVSNMGLILPLAANVAAFRQPLHTMSLLNPVLSAHCHIPELF